MNKLACVITIASLAAPAMAQDAARSIGDKQKSWTLANYRTGLSSCAVAGDADGFTVSGEGVASFNDRTAEGFDLEITAGADRIAPTVTAHAINSKGTGSFRQASGKSCVTASSHGTGGSVGLPNSACNVSGDPDAPILRFTIPLSSFGAAARRKEYVGHVTLLRREAGTSAPILQWSKKGVSEYMPREAAGSPQKDDFQMAFIATCETSGLSAKPGKRPQMQYDLAVGTKA